MGKGGCKGVDGDDQVVRRMEGGKGFRSLFVLNDTIDGWWNGRGSSCAVALQLASESSRRFNGYLPQA
jgi:hypothetical protein